MRNSYHFSIPRIISAILLVVVAGCGSQSASPQAKVDLNAGYAALESQQYDQAIAAADAYLQRTPAGEGSAEALYLRGRAMEQRPATSQSMASSNLLAAQSSYNEALRRSPSRQLEGYIHTSLGNVDYFLDDFAGAAVEWETAYNKLDDSNIKAWVLYRIGVCKQRLGQFADADRYFNSVQQQYPNSVPAQRSQDHLGARGFSVQFAAFTSAQAADDMVNSFRRDGVTAGKKTDAKGRFVVLAGPFPSFQQAQSLKARYATKYPDALVVP